MRLLLWCSVCILVCGSGCGQANNGSPPVTIVNRPNDPEVHIVKGSNEEMNAAIKTARASIDRFLEALSHPKPSQSSFSVKAKFVDGTENEHMWLVSVTHDGQKFSGEVNNRPLKLRNIAMGDKVSVAPGEISDWMYVENKKLVGGFTLRVVRDRMSEEERQKFDKDLGFIIE